MDIGVKQSKAKHSKATILDFEELYGNVRHYENKVYTDSQVRSLPDFAVESAEWRIRKHSSERLLTHLKKKRKFLHILEVGCGNGWLAAQMAAIPKTYVTGLDVNMAELNQANRVFKRDNLEFIYDTFNENTFNKDRFDVLIFAASLQYFPSVVNVLRLAERFLKPGGEIHIMDTPFYNAADATAAAGRCRVYYTNMGIPAMADHYFHHSISEFWGFNYRVLFNPANVFNRLFVKDPFHWIIIKK